MFNLTYEFKLKPTAKQVSLFENWLEQCRKVYNYALAERKDWYKSRSCQVNACSVRSEYIIPAEQTRPTYASQCRGLTAARKAIEELRAVQVHVLQQTLKRLEKAFVSMWEQGHGFPRFKKQGQMRSFVFPQLGVKPVESGKVKLPKIGWVKMRQSREIPSDAVVKQARVVRRATGWYVMLTLQWDVDVPQIMPHGEPLGIDVGISHFVAVSNGKLFPNPRPFKGLERKLKLLQKRVSRKRKGSSNRCKAQAKVSKLHERIVNIRKNYYWKLAHNLCDWAGMIFVEDLNLKGLAKGMLGKHCLDAGWGQFFKILEQCCAYRGVYFQKVDSKKTSQICPNCLTETGKKTLAERIHHCEHCGYTTDRDVAAAQIIAIRGLAAVGHTVKMLSEGKFIGIPGKKESSSL
ncbi:MULTISPECIES: RNA-guided endonuclease TnpB family protein [Moorena]|uniref:Transposase n=1 Tax=Moorena producens PAL-8-15-08-1 TaxID=1458985 RepID=A0A1D8TXW9_9CYAN|nr:MULTISPECIES: RNA-guided endonuclease TnpB family protein [Moorena]NEO51086.1 transposase [Moorena sp. SIO4A3]AOX02424.1 transposase [Moorena producens PAL-8-15-08-1]NEO16039.1 transposase [Moorena sp. SIO3E8]NEP28338.1 transposase [Moorena sp. SIO3I6]NEP98226.1 transposase [Moorena sp. SIO3F7]